MKFRLNHGLEPGTIHKVKVDDIRWKIKVINIDRGLKKIHCKVLESNRDNDVGCISYVYLRELVEKEKYKHLFVTNDDIDDILF